MGFIRYCPCQSSPLSGFYSLECTLHPSPHPTAKATSPWNKAFQLRTRRAAPNPDQLSLRIYQCRTCDPEHSATNPLSHKCWKTAGNQGALQHKKAALQTHTHTHKVSLFSLSDSRVLRQNPNLVRHHTRNILLVCVQSLNSS